MYSIMLIKCYISIGIKQKQRLERTKTPTPELTPEEPSTPESVPDFSPLDSQQDGMQDLYDIFTSDAPQQQRTPPSSDDGAMPTQQFTPQSSTEQSNPGITTYPFHARSQQQLTPGFYDTSLLQQSPRFNNDCVTPLQRSTSTTQPSCVHTPTAGTTPYLYNSGSMEQPLPSFHNGCAQRAPHQHCQTMSHDCGGYPQQRARPIFANTQPTCACTPTPGSPSCHAQQMHHLYDRAPQWASWTRPEDYTRGSYGQIEASRDLNVPFSRPPHPSHSYMSLPPPTERGCCCHHHHNHHNHTHLPPFAHHSSTNGFDVPHPYQNSRMLL